MPTHSSELALFLFITFLIPFNFLLPKVDVSLRQAEVFAILMTMPKTAVHKDDRAVFYVTPNQEVRESVGNSANSGIHG